MCPPKKTHKKTPTKHSPTALNYNTLPHYPATQGHIWRAGYETGQLRSHVYPDVAPALERWAKRGLKVGFSRPYCPAI